MNAQAEPKVARQVTMTVMQCARCGKDHYLPLVFIAFDNPIVENDGTVWTMWASCPNTLAPLLARDVNGRIKAGE